MPITHPQNDGQGRARRGAAVALWLLAAAVSSHAAELTEQQQRGKHIYMNGESLSGAPITAVVAKGATPLSAAFLPCSGCHGEDGLGRPEGGVNPPNITWEQLTTPHGHTHDYGRAHPSFDEHGVAVATIAGLDPAGNELDPAMPRFEMAEGDMADLVAYLKVISSDLDPGISADAIRIGTLLPVEGRLAEVGAAMRHVIEAAFADVNESGGIYGRRLELIAGVYTTDRLQAEWNIRDFVAQDAVFALVSGYVAGIENEVAAIAEEAELPLVGPFTPTPADGHGGRRYSFYLLGGIAEQARALATQVADRQSQVEQRVAIIHPNATVYQQAAKAAAAALESEPVMLIHEPRVIDVVDFAATLKAEKITSVLFLDPAADLKRLAEELKRIDWMPDLLLPGVFANKRLFEIDPAYAADVRVAYSSIPSDHTPQGIEEFERLHARHGLGYEHSTAQISAFVATKILIEGLKRAGRDLSRERFVDAVENLSDFEPGLMPPLSYNSARRIGALGAYIVSIDLASGTFAASSPWMDLQQ